MRPPRFSETARSRSYHCARSAFIAIDSRSRRTCCATFSLIALVFGGGCSTPSAPQFDFTGQWHGSTAALVPRSYDIELRQSGDSVVGTATVLPSSSRTYLVRGVRRGDSLVVNLDPAEDPPERIVGRLVGNHIDARVTNRMNPSDTGIVLTLRR